MKGDINDKDATVVEYDLSDVRDLVEGLQPGEDAGDDDKGVVNVIYGFGTDDEGWYLVNTSGRIQTGTKSGTKDGNEWYWYMYKDNIMMYTDSKKLGLDNVKDQTNSLKNVWKNTLSENIGKVKGMK